MLDESLVIVLRDRKHIAAKGGVFIYALNAPPLYQFKLGYPARLVILPNQTAMLEPNPRPNIVMQARQGL